jgi:hypothetical protein
MAGIIDGLLGAGVGAAGAVVNNAMFNRQQQAEQDKENRAMDRETFLMELRAKYAKDQAQFTSDLQSGLMDKQAQITKDNAKYNNDLALDDYKAKGNIDMDKWTKQNNITHTQALELLNRQQAGQRSLMAMRNAAKGGSAGGDDDSDIGNPDFVKARKDLTGYLGIDLNDRMGVQAARTKLGLAGNSSDNDVGEVLKAATLVYAANPTIDPNEAAKMGRDLAYGKIRLTPVPLSNGKTINSFMVNGKRYAYGRPN